MRFSVLGVGSVGSLIAHHLRRTRPAEDSVRLLFRTSRDLCRARSGPDIRVERDGVTSVSTGFDAALFDAFAEVSQDLASPHGNRATENASPTPTELPSLDHFQTRHTAESPIIESLIVAAKAYSVIEPIKRLLPQLSSYSTIVLFQNGMGVYEDLIHTVFRNPDERPNFIVASNTHGTWLKNSNHIVHAGLGKLEFAIIPNPHCNFEASAEDPNTPEYERCLDVNDIPVSGPTLNFRTLRHTVIALQALLPLYPTWVPHHEMQNIQRRKLVVNSVVNPLTGLMGCRNGDLFTTDASRRIVKRVCKEAESVFLAEYNAAHALSPGATGAGHAVHRPELRGLSPMLRADALEQECLKVAQATAQNFSSMLMDIRKGRRTEIGYLNGFLLKLGRTYRVPMPCTAMLLDLTSMRSYIPLPTNL